MRAELQRRQSNLDRMEAFLKARPGEWIEARDFENVGGRQAWRSRLAECRTKRAMHIDNRLEKNAAGQVVHSYYRYREFAPIGRDPQIPAPAASKHPARQLPLGLR